MERLEGCSDFSTTAKHSQITKGKKLIVLIGDSRIKNWGVPHIGENVVIMNLGTAGATTPEILCDLPKALLMLNPDLYVVQLGINDLVAGSLCNPERREYIKKRTTSNLVSILEGLAEHGDRVLFLSIAPPIKVDPIRKLVWGNGLADDAIAVSHAVKERIKTDNIIFLDMKSILYSPKSKDWNKALALDALHWKPLVYHRLNEYIGEMSGMD